MVATRICRVAILAVVLSLASSGCKSLSDSKWLGEPDKFSVTDRPRKLPPIAPDKPNLHDPNVVPASYEKPAEMPPEFGSVFEPLPVPLPGPQGPDDDSQEERFPIDLATALELAGANSLQVALAREQLAQAVAQVEGANVLWVPSLRGGVVYNNHSGRIQDTGGDVINVNRSSLFVGGAGMTGQAPATGGSGGPARMFVDLALADVLFEPLAARQLVDAGQAEVAATFNDALLAAGQAYLHLHRAESQLAIAAEATENAKTLATLTSEFAQAGQGLEADAQRAQAELANRRRARYQALENVGVASAELARLLRLDPSVVLFPAEHQPVPLELVGTEVPLPALIEQALASRPEVGRQSAVVSESWTRRQQEHFRPWIPNVFAGFGGGGFGGSTGSSIDNFNGRSDVDVGAIWEFQNLGLGNRARLREASSVHQQAHIARAQVRDVIASEVARAYRQVESRRQQFQLARVQVESAMRALELNFEGIRGAAVRPIEAQQAIGALASARNEYVSAIIGFNDAQLFLIRSLGQPPSLNSAVLP